MKKKTIALASLLVVPAFIIASLPAPASAEDLVTKYDRAIRLKKLRIVEIKKPSGAGIIKLRRRSDNKLLETWRAFNDKGVDGRLGNFGRRGVQQGVAAIQATGRGRGLKLFNAKGRKIASIKVTANKYNLEFDSSPVSSSGKQNFIVVGAKTSATDINVKKYRYDVDNKKLVRQSALTATGLDADLIDDGFSIDINKYTRQVKVRDENGSTIAKFKVRSDGRLKKI